MLIPLLDATAVSITHGIRVLLTSLIFDVSLQHYLHLFDTYHLALAAISKAELSGKEEGSVTSLHGPLPFLFCQGLNCS